MFLKQLYLRNFRLHLNTEINFTNRLNIIAGKNGQGKTTLLESIYYLCTTKSFNNNSDKEAVSFNSNYFEIEGKFKGITDNRVKIAFDVEANKKIMYLNDKQFYKGSEVIGKFPVVILTLQDHSITYGSPADRRKFIDSVLSQAGKNYLTNLLNYNKVLRQRSKLLSDIKDNPKKELFVELEAWTEQLIAFGKEIIYDRLSFVNEFKIYLENVFFEIMEQAETPSIIYSFSDELLTKTEIENILKSELDVHKEDELRRASNLVGPHRDDFMFFINNYELRKFGSQGQHKTFQIALRFGEFFFLKDIIGVTPIFLLDDVFGELDSNRASRISKYLQEFGQSFITMTDLSNMSLLSKGETKVFEVSGGRVSI